MTLATSTAAAPAAAHAPINRITMDQLMQTATELGEQAGKGKDTQIKFLLSCCEGGYHNAVDLIASKHGHDMDDAVRLAETYVKAQGTATVFDQKAPNQAKLISTLRTAIKLGQWPKGGVGEPLGTVNSLLAHRQKLRRDPVIRKKVDDAANVFLKYARNQLKRDTLIEGQELFDFCMKKQHDLPTATDIVEGIRNKLQKLVNGQAAQCTAQDSSAEVQAAMHSLSKRLTDIAKGNKAP